MPMQIEIYTPSQGEALAPVQWNYLELKAQLTQALANYKGRIYTEDSIGDAKKDRAGLNKLADAIDGKRKEMKAFYLKPYEEFETQAKELTALVKTQAAEIDAQVKAFDEARKAEKQEHIKAIYREVVGDLSELVPYEKLHNPKWLNVGFSAKNIEAEIVEKTESIRAALASIDALGLPDDVGSVTAQIKRAYLRDFDLAAALAEKDRIEKERALIEAYEAARKKHMEEAEALKSEEVQESPNSQNSENGEGKDRIYTVDFRVFATKEQLGALKAFLHDTGIKFGKVPDKE